MEALLESLIAIQRRLNAAGIGSGVIGGLAVAAWGEVRATQDVDIRVVLGREEAVRLLEAIGDDYVPFGIDGPPDHVLRKFGMLFVRDSLGTRIKVRLPREPGKKRCKRHLEKRTFRLIQYRIGECEGVQLLTDLLDPVEYPAVEVAE